jgi:hypothetical protein
MIAQDPALLCGLFGAGAAMARKSSSVLNEPFVIALGMLEGNSGCIMMLLWS